MIKRIFSILATVLLISNFCLAAQIESEGTSWLQTFEGIAQNVAPDEMLMTDISEASNIRTGGIVGKYAKKDTAFYIERNLDGENVNTAEVTLKNDAGSGDASKTIVSGFGSFAADDVLHISFEYAVNSYETKNSITIRSRQSSKTVADPVTMMAISNVGAVTIFGKSIGYTLPLDRWVRFDLVITDLKGQNADANTPSKVDAYVDGKLFGENITFDSKSGKPNDVREALIGLATVIFKFQSGVATTYIDNYSLMSSKTLPNIQGVNLIHDNPAISGAINNETNEILLPDSITVDEFKAGLGENESRVSVRTSGGQEQSGNLSPGYVCVQRSDGKDVYYKLETYNRAVSFEEDFNDITDINDIGVDFESDSAVMGIEAGLGGRSDRSLVVSNLHQGGATLRFSGTALSDDNVIFEASIRKRNGAAVNISINSVDFDCENLRQNAWHKLVLVFNKPNSSWQAYVNGESLLENAVEFQSIDGLSINMTSENETARVELDDIRLYAGEYVSGSDDLNIYANSSNTIIKEDSKTIYIAADTDLESFMQDISTADNTLPVGVYEDVDIAALTPGNSITTGNYIVFKSLTESVFEPYEIIVITEPLGVASNTSIRYKFDNEELYIFTPTYTPVSNLIGGLILEPGHIGSVVDLDGNPVSGNVGRGTIKSGVKYKITYTNTVGTYVKEYDIRTEFYSENFDDLQDKKIYPGGYYNAFQFNRQGCTGSDFYMTGAKDPDDPNENVAYIYGKPDSITGDAKMLIRVDDLEKDQTSSIPYVISWDFRPASYANNVLITQYTNKDGTSSGGYYNYFNIFNASGVTSFMSTNVGSYKVNQWNRIVMLVNPSGTSPSKVYLNGKLVFSNTVGVFQKTIGFLENLLFTFNVSSSGREFMVDNMEFYPIHSVDSFDASGMDSAAKTEFDILSGSDITGYGPSNVEEFLELFTFPIGSTQAVFDGDTVLPLDATVSDGMKLVVTSADHMYSTSYNIGEMVRIEPIRLLIDERSMSYLIAGDATGWGEVYSARAMPMKLRLEYTDGETPLAVEAIRTSEDVGLTTLETEVVASVKNEEGEALKLTLTDLETGEDLATPIEIEWTGRLDLTSEIMAAKGGATSIVTLTLDDGTTGVIEKCNNWFAQHNLRGSSVVWSDRAASNVGFYQREYDKGYIDLTSHSKTHKELTDATSPDDRLAEIVGARDTLRSLFPGQEVLTFAPSNNRMDALSAEIARETFWAVRQGKRGYNSISPPENGTGGWYDLMIQGAHEPIDESGTSVSLNKILEIAASKPVWLIEMYHFIDASGEGTLPVYDSAAASHFSLMGRLQSEGKIWSASFNEATKYIRERQNTTITDIATEESRTVLLEMDTEKLPPEIFNYPLTIRSQVPEEWAQSGKYIKITQGGSVQAPNVRNADGGLYVYYDAIPTAGPIILESTEEKPVITITGITVEIEGELVQEADSVLPITFTATTTPADNTDTSGIQWYVNNTKVSEEDMGENPMEYVFNSDKAGKYEVYAMDSITGIKSKTTVITLKEPGVITFENYQGFQAGVGLQAAVRTAEYPENSGNIAAEVYYDSSQGYPGIHRSAAATVGQPLVYSGRVALVGEKQTFYLEARNTKTTTNRRTIFNFKNGVISAVDTGVVIGRIPNGEWLHYSLAITPAANGEMSKIRYTLSGTELTDANGKNRGVPIVHEIEQNLDALAIADNNAVNVVHNNNFSSADANCSTYIDNIRIYYPRTLTLTGTTDLVPLNGRATVDISKYLYFFDQSMVTVTSGGETVALAKAELDLTSPKELTLFFPEGSLEKNTQYEVTLDGTGLIDALGEQSPLTSTTFMTADADPITALSLSYQGEIEQDLLTLSTVTFTAITTPPHDSNAIDTNDIIWYVNNILQSERGLTFEYTPTSDGVYSVYAAVANTYVQSEEVAINVAIGPSTSLVISAKGVLKQYMDDLSTVVFRVDGLPVGSTLNEEDVVWFVNGEEQLTGSAEFGFLPNSAGNYSICAQLGSDATTMTAPVVVSAGSKPPALAGQILFDDFEQRGQAGVILTGENLAPWSGSISNDNEWVETANDPINLNNIVARFSSAGSAKKYPRLEKNGVDVLANKPYVVSGKILLSNTSSEFVVETRGNSRKEMFKFMNGGIFNVNGTNVSADVVGWSGGKWIWFSGYVEPNESAGQSKIRLVLSGNVTGEKVIEDSLSLDGVGLGTNKTVYYNSVITASKGDAVYVDDAKIYYYEKAVPLILDCPELGAKQFELMFNHDIDPNSVNSKDDIIVKDLAGNSYEVTSIEFNPLEPNKILVMLSEPLEDAEYVISLQETVLDINGDSITDETSFIPEGGTVPLNEYEFVESYFKADGVKTNEILQAAQSLIAVVDISRTELVAKQNFMLGVARYDENGKTLNVWTTKSTVPMGSGVTSIELAIPTTAQNINQSYKLFVWDNTGSMKYLLDSVEAVVLE